MIFGTAAPNSPVPARRRGRISRAILASETSATMSRLRRFRAAAVISFAVAMVLLAVPAAGQLTVTPITWDVVGLDHNRPLTSGPSWFPVGARVCSGAATTNVEVRFVWTDGKGNDRFGDGDAFINARPGSNTTLDFPFIGAGGCVDAYFELEVTRSPLAFGNSRQYTIVADDGGDPASTPAGRQIYIERLISQNRNATNQIRYCDPTAGGNCDPGIGGTGWVVVGAGGSINLAVGNTYFIELTSQTATAYEQLESFVTLSNTIFQVLSVSTTYSDLTAPVERVPVPNPRLWADGCLWDSDPTSPNYHSCLSTGKAGGQVITLYEIRIISGGGESVTLEALHYDRSGGSFHYNTDYSQPPADISVFDPTNLGFSKRFIPSTIPATTIDQTYTATLRFTITNPNPVTVSGYNFVDLLPEGMEVANPANTGTTCGGSVSTGTYSGTGRDFVEFAGGTVGPNGSCAIRVDVIVPFDAAASYPLDLVNLSGNLFIGDTDTEKNATATLTVNEEPDSPLVCQRENLAAWTAFSSASNPSPTFVHTGGTASAVGGAGLTFSTSSPGGDSRWEGSAAVNRTLAAARTAGAYFEFRLNTTGIEEVRFELRAWRQNANAPGTATLDYGPAGALVESTTLAVPNQNNKPTASNLVVTDLVANLNSSGDTVFRVYAYDGSGNPPVFIDDVLFTGIVLANCTENTDPPDPPVIAKVFSPASVRVGEASTLTFTLTNPNAGVALNDVTFRDELPPGMTAVSGTFVNNCSTGSSWGADGDLSILLFAGGRLAGGVSCTLAVDVVSTTIGDNENISDPIDARETLAGNSAEDTLEVGPPPTPPSIVKFFDPNLLLDPQGATRLTFRITNNDPDLAIASVAFTDELPEVDGVQMVPADDPFAFSSNARCGAIPPLSFTWDSGTFTLSSSGGVIAAGEICEIHVDVKVPGVDVSEDPVKFPNETSRVSHVFNGTTYRGNAAKATLLVDEPIPGITILKEVGLTDDPDGEWFSYLVTTPGPAKIYYKITVENTGEVELNPTTVSDPNVSVSGCSWTSPLPVASVENGNHISVCVVGPVDALEGTFPNTATATGTYGGAEYSTSSTARYKGQQPTAVVMGRVELLALPVGNFLDSIGAFEMERDGLLNLLRAWDPAAAGRLTGAGLEKLLAALAAFLDPDGDGLVVVFHWETLEERGTVGFYAERMAGGGWMRINSGMLPGLIASPMGAEYWLADPGARPGDGYRYRLIEVEAWGTTREYGPFDLRAGGGN